MIAIETSEIIKEGVGLLIPKRQNFFSIEERILNKSTGKVPGMRSMIFETIELGETHQDAIKRALREEVDMLNLLSDTLRPVELCKVQLKEGVWLYAYLLPIDIPDNLEISIGSTDFEVANPGWDMIDDVINSEVGNLRFRPGNREVLKSYKRFLSGNLTEPDTYLSTIDEIN
ncbi:MAG: hypothetical protein G01um101493_65 [Microgenomates group bacterium Gr01-1014_93]|nr:MAG: hypothetical protein G01um101493_65 [Microgenomates group bacterium Gr01-1014_93]